MNGSFLRRLGGPLPASLVLVVAASLFALPSAPRSPRAAGSDLSFIGATPAYAESADTSSTGGPTPTPDDPIRPHTVRPD